MPLVPGPTRETAVFSSGDDARERRSETPVPELSVVMPCLNERETLARCIEKAQRSFVELGLVGEVVIADNGSTDGSQEIATRHGARVVGIAAKGYGNALKGGILAARGRFVIMGDSDDSYDFGALGRFVEELRKGSDLVMGNRFRGGIRPGAMPWKHRWIGNPVLTGIGRFLFGSRSGDFHCGLRGFSATAFRRMALETSGMEFASEMVIRSTLLKLKVVEVPTVLHKDGRRRPPHLRSWRDGWRHLRFMLSYSPFWTLALPGAALCLAALLAGTIRPAATLAGGLPTTALWTAGFGLGVQLLVGYLLAKKTLVARKKHPCTGRVSRFLRWCTLERIFAIAALCALLATAGLLAPAPRAAVPALFGYVLSLQIFAAAFPLCVPGNDLTDASSEELS